jgi:flagellar M-ring protein FliF
LVITVIAKLLAGLRFLFGPLLEFWSGLSRRRKLNLIAFALVVFGALWGLRWYLTERGYRPLYTDLTDREAGAAAERLRQMQVPYRLAANGSTILVPESRLDELRLQLASEGLPQSGRLGFELFDQTNFGATEFAEQVNFRRALEGELERSVLSLNRVERARVHISLPKRSVFLDYDQPAKASVVVQLRPGAELTPQQTDGIRHLVASAVEGLEAGQVVLVDTRGRLLVRPHAGSEAITGEQLEYRQRLERQIESKIEATLEPYVGFDKVRVNAAADVDWSQGEQTEEVLDPNTLVMTTQKLQETAGPPNQSGAPGTASNVPRQPLGPGVGGVANSRVTETTNYQTSRTVTRMELKKGAVKRLSVAVLVDSKVRNDEAGNIVREPRTEPELLSLRQLAVAAGGIVEERGDRLTLESLPFTIFEPLPEVPVKPGPPGWLEFALEIFQKYRYYVIAGAVAALLLFAASGWLIHRTSKKFRARRQAQLEADRQRQELEAAEAEAKRQEAEQARLLSGLKMDALQSSRGQVLKKHLEEAATKDTTGFVQMLRAWIHEDER